MEQVQLWSAIMTFLKAYFKLTEKATWIIFIEARSTKTFFNLYNIWTWWNKYFWFTVTAQPPANPDTRHYPFLTSIIQLMSQTLMSINLLTHWATNNSMYLASRVSFDRKIEGDSAREVLAIKFLSALHDGAFKSQSYVFMELKLLRS